MKSLSAIALAILLIVPASNAQDRVRERDLEGTVWKMEFNLKEEGDGAFERIILNAVDGLMDEIDIQLEFGKRGHLSVWVDAFSRDEDEEEGLIREEIEPRPLWNILLFAIKYDKTETVEVLME